MSDRPCPHRNTHGSSGRHLSRFQTHARLDAALHALAEAPAHGVGPLVAHNDALSQHYGNVCVRQEMVVPECCGREKCPSMHQLRRPRKLTCHCVCPPMFLLLESMIVSCGLRGGKGRGQVWCGCQWLTPSHTRPRRRRTAYTIQAQKAYTAHTRTQCLETQWGACVVTST